MSRLTNPVRRSDLTVTFKKKSSGTATLIMVIAFIVMCCCCAPEGWLISR